MIHAVIPGLVPGIQPRERRNNGTMDPGDKHRDDGQTRTLRCKAVNCIERDPQMKVDRLWINGRLATFDPAKPGLGAIEDGSVAAKDGRIAWVGPRAEMPQIQAAEIVDLDGRWVTPGLVDCHTHLVFAGNRAQEFELRLAGASYEEIARAGGGILSTVKATRAASEEELVAAALPRLDALIAEGVTTIEIKSGYGLELETEARQLRAARRLGQVRPVSVATTFLGAHALPPEAEGDKDQYIARLCSQMLPEMARAGLADAVDAFMEGIGFSGGQTARVFEVAKRLGLPVKLHADQLSNLGGATLAARYGALSADHLEHTDEAGAAAMAKAGTVAVLLPGAFYFIRETRRPPVELFRKHRVPIAIATDCNPGSSPLTSLLLAMNMGATLFRLTVDELIGGVTREAARALGRLEEIGTLETGKWCDLAIWDVERLAELPYHMGLNPLHARTWRGR
jgi:imidazolonepropionase